MPTWNYSIRVGVAMSTANGLLPIRHASDLGLEYDGMRFARLSNGSMTETTMLNKIIGAGFLLFVLGHAQLQAQLAITETMPSASTNNTQATTAGQGPDFWELTNFGTNAVDLTGYRFNDSDATLGGDANSAVFSGVTIGPGESIILVQNTDGSGVTNRDDFIAWWGAANLPVNLQVLFYSGNGLSSSGDSIVLWNNTATSDADYLDRADFGESLRGHSFTYNTNTGIFGIISSNGVAGAFTASTSDDQGSPGKTAGPVALAFTQQPTPSTQSVPAGQNATFTAAAKGFPHPHFQWRFQGLPIDGAIRSTLTVTNAQLADGGSYSVVITNGLMSLTSSVAVLTVTTSPVAPIFITSPKDAAAFEGQTVQFVASVNGSPTPALQWRSNGVALASETANTLTLLNVQSNQAAVYTLIATNSAGSNAISAVLTVTAKPRLLITEVHSTGSSANKDWWELTSFESYPINLKGWRWDDDGHSLAPNNAYTFSNNLVISPGESIIFVEDYTPAQFRAWWTNLPSSLQIVSYTGGGLGLSSSKDEVNLWNAVTLVGNELFERVAAVNFAASPNGVGFVYDPENPPIAGVMNVLSTNTVNGLVANGMLVSTNGAIGSPGRVIAPVQITNSIIEGSHLLTWNAANNRGYVVEYKNDLFDPNWTVLTNFTAGGASTSFSEPVGTGSRYYRVGATIPFVFEQP